MMIKYYDDEENVGVILSPEFGAGWSTWNDEDDSPIPTEFLVMDKTLVKMCLEEVPLEEVQKYVKLNFPKNELYFGGWGNCIVIFIKPKVRFRITEYDGKEGIEFLDNTEWLET